MDWRRYGRDGLLLLFLIVLCAFLIRFLAGGETLKDYQERKDYREESHAADGPPDI